MHPGKNCRLGQASPLGKNAGLQTGYPPFYAGVPFGYYVRHDRDYQTTNSGSMMAPFTTPTSRFLTPAYVPPQTVRQFARPDGQKLRDMPALIRDVHSPDKTDADSGIYTDSEQDEPMDLSCKRNSLGHIPALPRIASVSESSGDSTPSPVPESESSVGGFSVAIQDTSYLRDLLSRDRSEDGSAMARATQYTTVGPNTRVSLAKKNLLPVSARISDWLMKIVQFAESVPEFKVLSYNDKVNLVLSSWSRLLLLFMAENSFHFVVSPDTEPEAPTSPACPSPGLTSAPSSAVPTMKCVETIQTIIRKFQALNVDAKEYLMLRIAVLFQCEPAYLETPDIVSNVRHQVLECLRQHVHQTRPDDVMHYPKLLMALPILYSVHDKMLENLFCKHIAADTDVSVLLKEMLNNM